MKKLISVLMAAVVALPLVLLSSCTAKRQFSKSDLSLFDTQTIILGYEYSENDFEATAKKVIDELSLYHKLYDIYNEYDGINNLKTINDNAGIAPVTVDQRIIDLLLYAKEMYSKTDGTTNVALGSVLSIWHRYREAGINDPDSAAIPTDAELSAASEHTDIQKVIIDEKALTVYLADSEMSLDVGAIAKGYSVEMAAQMLEGDGISGYALSVGGNVRCIGEKPDGKKWEIGIQNPNLDSDSPYVEKTYLSTEALVTSGTYQRYYTVNGKRYHHIIDPRTLMPSDDYASVSVICSHSGLADALSTALFNMSESDGRKLAKKLGVHVMWVYPDQTVKTTEGFERLTK